MSAVMEASETSAKYLNTLRPPLVQHFELMATAPGGVAKLRELILTLAVQGKLVPQDPKDEPASELLKKIRVEKDRLIAEGKIKRDKPLLPIEEEGQPFTLPRGWKWVRLGTLLPFRIGKTPPSKDPQYWSDEGYAWVSISDMTHFGEVFDTDRKITAKGASVFGYEPLPVGTLIMSFKLTIGKIATLQVPAYHNEAIVSFLPLAGLQPKFLKYVLPTVSKTGASKDALMGATLNTESLSNLLIALPPEAEQPRIVTRVEELMRLCDALEAKDQLEAAQHAQLVQTLLDALTTSTSPDELAENWQRVASHFDLLLDRPEAIDALEQTILQLAVRGLLVPQDPKDEPASELLKKIRAEKDRLIAEGKIKRDKPLADIADDEKPYGLPDGWSWARVGSLGITMTGGTPASSNPAFFNGSIPFIGPGQITLDGKLLPAEKFLSELGCAESAMASHGDILMVCIGGSIGKCAAATYTTAFNQQINSIAPLVVAKEYVLQAMSGRDFSRAVLAAATGSATPIISKGKWDTLLLPVPPLKEQLRIVARVESLRCLCADLRQRLAAHQTTQANLAEALIDEVT